MKYSRYWGIMTLVVCFGLFGPGTLAAQEFKTVYLVRQLGQNEVWTMNMGIQTEAVRLFVPTAFERKGKTIRLSTDTPRVSISSGRETVISRTVDGILVGYEVSVAGVAPLPRADRSITIRFTLAELGAATAAEAEMPGSYAIRQAILKGPYSKGQVWVQHIDFKDNRFSAVIGLKR